MFLRKNNTKFDSNNAKKLEAVSSTSCTLAAPSLESLFPPKPSCKKLNTWCQTAAAFLVPAARCWRVGLFELEREGVWYAQREPPGNTGLMLFIEKCKGNTFSFFVPDFEIFPYWHHWPLVAVTTFHLNFKPTSYLQTCKPCITLPHTTKSIRKYCAPRSFDLGISTLPSFHSGKITRMASFQRFDSMAFVGPGPITPITPLK